MVIPISCGKLRVEGVKCFLEHRSSSNHPLRTPLVKAGAEGGVGSAEEVASYLLDEVGLANDSLVLIDGFLVGDGDDLTLAVRSAAGAPSHQGTLIYSGSQSLLDKGIGTRLLKRFGDPGLATQMLLNCGKANGDLIEVTGVETLSSGGVASIEMDSVKGC
jgi:hypothetical protein